MELFVSLALLYLAQCLIWLPGHESIALFWPRIRAAQVTGRATILSGGGWRLAHPLPASISLSGRVAIPGETDRARLDALRDEIDLAIRHTRGLRWLGACQLTLVAVAGPGLALWVGAEAAILYGVLPFATLHLLGLVLLFRASRKLPTDPAGRAESLFIAALYPPALMRAGTDGVRRAFADHALVETLAVRLDADELEAYLRLQIGRLRSPRFAGSECERATLLEVAQWRGLDVDSLCRPRVRLDPSAESYCEACGLDFRAGFRFCEQCRIETTLYPLDA